MTIIKSTSCSVDNIFSADGGGNDDCGKSGALFDTSTRNSDLDFSTVKESSILTGSNSNQHLTNYKEHIKAIEKKAKKSPDFSSYNSRLNNSHIKHQKLYYRFVIIFIMCAFVVSLGIYYFVYKQFFISENIIIFIVIITGLYYFFAYLKTYLIPHIKTFI